MGEIDINEEDRELIIYSYNSDTPTAIGFFAEKAVAEYYTKSGYQVIAKEIGHRSIADFIANKDGVNVAVEVKSVRPRTFAPMMKLHIERRLNYINEYMESNSIAKMHIVVVLRNDNEFEYPLSRLFSHALRFGEEYGSKFQIHIGRLDDEGAYVPLEVSDV